MPPQSRFKSFKMEKGINTPKTPKDCLNTQCAGQKRLIWAVLIAISLSYANIPTNTDFTINQVNKFVKSYSNNRLTAEQVWQVYWQSQAFKIHPLVVFTIMEKESSLVSNPSIGKYRWREHRCCGYGLIHASWTSRGKFYLYGGFTVQVHSAAKAVRKSLDRWSKKGFENITMTIGGEETAVNNVYDYAKYRYTPFTWGKADYDKIYNKFKIKWREVNNGNR